MYGGLHLVIVRARPMFRNGITCHAAVVKIVGSELGVIQPQCYSRVRGYVRFIER